MKVEMSGMLAGAKKVDFESYQHANLYLLVSVKNGVGQQTQKFKYPGGFSDYEKLTEFVGGNVNIVGDLQTDDKGLPTVIVKSISAFKDRSKS